MDEMSHGCGRLRVLVERGKYVQASMLSPAADCGWGQVSGLQGFRLQVLCHDGVI